MEVEVKSDPHVTTETDMQKLEITKGKNKSKENYLPPEIDMVYVNRFLWILFASNFCVNIDMGILPACTLKMSQELNLETADMGMLGSIVYCG